MKIMELTIIMGFLKKINLILIWKQYPLLNEHLNQLYKIVEIKEKRNFNYYTIQELTDDKKTLAKKI